MMLSLRTAPTISEAIAAARDRLTELLLDCRGKRTATLFLSSGGNALRILPNDMRVIGPHLTVGVVDERCDERQSNARSLCETPFGSACKKAGIFSILTESYGTACSERAGQYEKMLTEWRMRNSEGMIIATFGIGADGHTAGIFAKNPEEFNALFLRERLVAYHRAHGIVPSPDRFTITGTFMRFITESIVIVTGIKKKNALASCVRNGPPNRIPARLLKQLNGTLYIDEGLRRAARLTAFV